MSENHTHPISADGDAPITIYPCEQALAMMEDLIESGLRGNTREEVALSLIYDQLKHLASRRIVAWQPKP